MEKHILHLNSDSHTEELVLFLNIHAVTWKYIFNWLSEDTATNNQFVSKGLNSSHSTGLLW